MAQFRATLIQQLPRTTLAAQGRDITSWRDKGLTAGP